MTDAIQVVTTAGSQDEAQRIAEALVGDRLAACVQVSGPIRSTFHWKGQTETEEEWHCVAKTRAGLFESVEQAIRQAHSYDVPEILAVPIVAAGNDYLAWLKAETRQG